MKWLLIFSLLGVCYSLLPVVLVPGWTGSVLEAKISEYAPIRLLCGGAPIGQYFKVWINETFFKNSFLCAIGIIGIQYSALLGESFEPFGVTVRPKDVGNVTGVENIASQGDGFATMNEFLKGKGYVDGVNLTAFPYDFRLGSMVTHPSIDIFKELIENTSNKNGAKVVIICHSMGGLVTLKLLNSVSQEWKEKYVERVISLSAVYGGTVLSLLLSNAGQYAPYVQSPGIAAIFLRYFVRQWTSSYWLYPNPEAFPKDDILVATPWHDYTASDMLSLIIDSGNVDGARIYPEEHVNLTAPGVEVQCLHGIGLKTISRLTYKHFFDFPLYPEKMYGKGDGTVNLASLLTCKQWVGKGKTVNIKSFNNVSHGDMIKNMDVINYLYQYL